jgi:hypothetical protein
MKKIITLLIILSFSFESTGISYAQRVVSADTLRPVAAALSGKTKFITGGHSKDILNNQNQAACDLLEGKVRAVWGHAGQLGRMNERGEVITLTPEVYRVIQPYTLPVSGYLKRYNITETQARHMEREDNVDKKSQVVIDALFNLAHIEDKEVESLLRKLFVVRSLIKDEEYMQSLVNRVAEEIAKYKNPDVIDALWKLCEAARLMMFELRMYESDLGLPLVSISPIKKQFLIIEQTIFSKIGDEAAARYRYNMHIVSVLISLCMRINDELMSQMLADCSDYLYDNLPEDIVRFMIQRPSNIPPMLENIYKISDPEIYYRVIEKLHEKGITVKKSLLDLEILSITVLLPDGNKFSVNVSVFLQRQYDSLYKRYFTDKKTPINQGPFDLAAGVVLKGGQRSPGLRTALYAIRYFFQDTPKNDLQAFLSVLNVRKSAQGEEIVDAQIEVIAQKLQHHVAGTYYRYSDFLNHIITVSDLYDEKTAVANIRKLLAIKRDFIGNAREMKGQIVSYFSNEIQEKKEKDPNWPEPLGLLAGMNDMLSHYIWRVEHFFDRLEYEVNNASPKTNSSGREEETTAPVPKVSSAGQDVFSRDKAYVRGRDIINEMEHYKENSSKDLYQALKWFEANADENSILFDVWSFLLSSIRLDKNFTDQAGSVQEALKIGKGACWEFACLAHYILYMGHIRGKYNIDDIRMVGFRGMASDSHITLLVKQHGAWWMLDNLRLVQLEGLSYEEAKINALDVFREGDLYVAVDVNPQINFDEITHKISIIYNPRTGKEVFDTSSQGSIAQSLESAMTSQPSQSLAVTQPTHPVSAHPVPLLQKTTLAINQAA